MSVLVTGAAGFIGFHLCKRLLSEGYKVIGIDNLNNYYDKSLKNDRINQLNKISSIADGNFSFFEIDISKSIDLKKIFNANDHSHSKISVVVNLAAQAGVRYSIENPAAYVESNLVGFNNIIEECRKNKIDHFIYASSSSVYGANKKMPFSEKDNVDHPVSLYAATKKSNELVAHTYSHLFDLPTTGLRFFTVYGPWGRPDMAYSIFTKLILQGKPIRVFNYGKMIRDFTYIDDVIESLFRLLNKPPVRQKDLNMDNLNPSNSWAPYKIFNVGNSKPTNLGDYIFAIEKNLNRKAEIIYEEIQPGDVEATFADTKYLEEWVEFSPNTSIDEGIKKYVDWYLKYYKVNNI